MLGSTLGVIFAKVKFHREGSNIILQDNIQSSNSINSPKTVEIPNDLEEIAEYGIENAINYLDYNDVWEKSEMEKYPNLQGLFDDLNQWDTYKLYTYWSHLLMESYNFTKILKALRKNYNKGWNPKVGQHFPTYNNSEDYKINVNNYIRWLDNQCTQIDSQSKTSKFDKNFLN